MANKNSGVCVGCVRVWVWGGGSGGGQFLTSAKLLIPALWVVENRPNIPNIAFSQSLTLAVLFCFVLLSHPEEFRLYLVCA